MSYSYLQTRLRIEAKRRISNGELTERGLSKLTGISQPHIHNVLKGFRCFSPEVGDRILKALHLQLLDLYSAQELLAECVSRAQPQLTMQIPFLKSAVGFGQPWSGDLDTAQRCAAPVPPGFVLECLALARLMPDPGMATEIGTYDIALLDRSARAVREPDSKSLYVVRRRAGTAVRFVRYGRSGIYLAAADCEHDPAEWELISAASIEAVVCGHVLWIGREQDAWIPGNQRGRALVATSR